jgi:hypothetical protein
MTRSPGRVASVLPGAPTVNGRPLTEDLLALADEAVAAALAGSAADVAAASGLLLGSGQLTTRAECERWFTAFRAVQGAGGLGGAPRVGHRGHHRLAARSQLDRPPPGRVTERRSTYRAATLRLTSLPGSPACRSPSPRLRWSPPPGGSGPARGGRHRHCAHRVARRPGPGAEPTVLNLTPSSSATCHRLGAQVAGDVAAGEQTPAGLTLVRAVRARSCCEGRAASG